MTDVFQAVLDGTNAVMLSAESASGEHPIESVRTLRLVSEFAEHVKKMTFCDERCTAITA